MKEGIDKVFGRIKHKPEDFIVEEIGEDWSCSVSKKFDPYKKTSPDNLLESDEERDFVWCEMEKRDIDHFQAIKELSQRLRKQTRDIGYAGTKDRYAITSQRISIFHPTYEELANFHHPRIILKKFKWAKRKIKLGYLKENHFELVIRDVEKKDAIKISNAISKTKHFPNYFGEQRFGTLRGNNVSIGKEILKGNYKEAVWRLLTDLSPNEREDVKEAREKLAKEQDFKEAVKYFPSNLRLEKQVLHHLSRKPEDFLGALKYSERKNILMFINSVQSKIFNEILDRGFEEKIDFTKSGQENGILAGYKTHFTKGRLGNIEQEVLESHGISLEDFDIKDIPFLRMKGSFRKALTKVKNLKIEVEDDEEFEKMKKINLKFTLPSGVYATTFLGNFFDLN